VSNLSSTSFSRLHFTFASFSSLNCSTFGPVCYSITSFYPTLHPTLHFLTSLSADSAVFLHQLVSLLFCSASPASRPTLLCSFTTVYCIACHKLLYFFNRLSPNSADCLTVPPNSAVFLHQLLKLLCCLSTPAIHAAFLYPF
jgi:hypothetical protein